MINHINLNFSVDISNQFDIMFDRSILSLMFYVVSTVRICIRCKACFVLITAVGTFLPVISISDNDTFGITTGL